MSQKNICETCNKSFTTLGNLTKHIKTSKSCAKVRGEKPKTYDCTFCSKSFTSQNNREKHEKTCDKLAEFAVKQQEEMKADKKKIAELEKQNKILLANKTIPLVEKQSKVGNIPHSKGDNTSPPLVGTSDKNVIYGNNQKRISIFTAGDQKKEDAIECHTRFYNKKLEDILCYEPNYVPPEILETHTWFDLTRITNAMTKHCETLERDPVISKKWQRPSKEDIDRLRINYIPPCNSNVKTYTFLPKDDKSEDEDISVKPSKQVNSSPTKKEELSEKYFNLAAEIILSIDRNYQYNRDPSLAEMRKNIPIMEKLLHESDDESEDDDENEENEYEYEKERMSSSQSMEDIEEHDSSRSVEDDAYDPKP